jgi:hypothetical protein
MFGSPRKPGAADDAIAELVRRIMASAVAATKPLVSDRSPMTVPVLLDHIFFNYQWVDRVAAKVLGAGRPAFMGALRDALNVEMMSVLFSHLAPDQRRLAVVNLDPFLDDFLVEFAQYGAPTPETPGPSETLFYEFGKKIANKLGKADQAFIVAAVATSAAGGLKAIDAPALMRSTIA